MSKRAFEVCSADRGTKITFLAEVFISAVIDKANTYDGLHGSKLVSENSGSTIADDETLEYLADKNVCFMILNEGDRWTSPNSVLPTMYVENPKIIIDQQSVEGEPLLQNDKLNRILNYVADLNCISQSNNQSNVVDQNDIDDSNVSGLPNSLTTTLSMSSTAFSSSSSTNSAALKLFADFQIPWSNLPSDIIFKINNKQKLENRLSCFVNFVVEEIRRTSYYVPIRILRSIAENIVNTYPDTFEQRDKENRVISSSSEMLITMMRNRNNYRNHQSNNHNGPKIPIKKRRMINSFKNNVKNWQPHIIEDLSVGISMEDKKKNLMDMFPNNPDLISEKEKILQLMKECYAIQRQYFNDKDNYPTIIQIQENWPYIFKRDCLYQHFVELLAVNADKLYNSSYKSEKKSIMQYFKISENQSDDMAIFDSIATYFKEDFKCILQKFSIGTTLDTVRKGIPGRWAWIAIIQTSLDSEICYIFIEKNIIVSTEKFIIMDLIMQSIAFSYTFNLEYPQEASQTLDFIARFFLNHYPDRPRGPKKNNTNNTKINNLIRKLHNQK